MASSIRGCGRMLVLAWVTVYFLFAGGVGANYNCSDAAPKFPKLIDVTTEDLIVGLEGGQFTSVDLVNAYIARINEVQSMLNVVTEINPDALSIAAALDAERAAGNVRGPLHGVPILIKNNIATMDKMNNTAGSYALLGATVPRDSQMARKLRESGAIILGKTNLSQWANFRSSNSSNGWSAYGGQVFAAYIPMQDPSGSSSGSGVASSLGLALASLGTETSGSIVSPSNRNNLVGIKPTVGLTSRNLVIPISEHQDTIGPMARTVKDAAYLLQAIAGVDPFDNYTSAIPSNGSIPDYVAACKFTALKGARIGIPSNVVARFMANNASAPEAAAFMNAINTIRAAGATIVTGANFTAYQQYIAANSTTTVLQADFLVNLKQYLALLTSNPTGVTDLQDVTDFTQTFPAEEYPNRDTAVFDGALGLGFDNTSPQFWQLYQQNLFLGGEGGVLGALERNQLDAVILPTSTAAGVPALVGAPIVTVPLGFYPPGTAVVRTRRNLVSIGPNVPFGLSFLGQRFSEEKLVGFAYAYEQRTKVRNQVQPYVVPMTEVCDISSNC